MTTDSDCCAEAANIRAITAAFLAGDLTALRAAVDDPSVVPNGQMPAGIGSCLVSAIYHSPLPFIRTLLEVGADPNAPADDGFPPIIAALSCSRKAPGAPVRTDVEDIVRLLLSFGADPNQRGINDYTPLHMAVAERQAVAALVLLEGGADPDLRTRIDNYDSPLEMALAVDDAGIAALLASKGKPPRRRLRSGLTLLIDLPGTGELVRRQHNYRIRLRLWLNRGEAVKWPTAWGPVGLARLEDNGETLITEVRIDRRSLVAGLFYGVEGMRVGGLRRLEVGPHLGYGARGVPGMIPADALFVAEITILEARTRAGMPGAS